MGDIQEYMDKTVENIVKDLSKPENQDLLIAVRDLGSGSLEESFMFGFTMILDTESEWATEHNEKAVLDENQTRRFDALVEVYDNGWSGFAYGYIMRRVQYELRQVTGEN